MSGLFGGAPNYNPNQIPVQYQTQNADMAVENAGLFERLQRSSAYGPQQTRLAGQKPGGGHASSWEAWARDATITLAARLKNSEISPARA
jgi:hypothetical protein